MNEKDIREQTRLILDAYSELSGEETIPDVRDFLLIRAAAIGELRDSTGDRGEKTQSMTPPQKPEAQKKSVRRKKAAPLPEAGPAAQDSAANMEKAVPETAIADIPSLLEDVPETPESDFDILRRIKDPWN